MTAFSPSAILIRPEQPGDATRIRQINELAFEGTVEADLIDALRAASGVTLSMVAVLGGEVIGGDALDGSAQPGGGLVGGEVYGGEVVAHALVTPVTVSTQHGEISLLGLGPVAVLPAEQGQGIGTHLIESCLERLRAYGHGGVVVVGEPGYYQRFGFIPASRWGLRWEVDVSEENFMALELSPGMLAGVSGVVRYRPEFSEV